MVLSEQASVMLLTHEKFAEFAKLPMADPATHTLALYCFSVSAREEVDQVAEAAIAAGGVEADGLEDYGFMCSRSFFDLDGHGWQVMWMDPAAAQAGPERYAASIQTAAPA
jgi:predicted lactoylglutathione lyase